MLRNAWGVVVRDGYNGEGWLGLVVMVGVVKDDITTCTMWIHATNVIS